MTQAVTRGDGVVQGEDVTENARVIKDIKQKLKDSLPYFEIRGEVYMSREAFAKVNERQELLGLKTFANPRNCAAGTLRQLDSRITKERNLSMFIFNLQTVTGREFATHTEAYEFMKKIGKEPKNMVYKKMIEEQFAWIRSDYNKRFLKENPEGTMEDYIQEQTERERDNMEYKMIEEGDLTIE